jgi:hypothetical protein
LEAVNANPVLPYGTYTHWRAYTCLHQTAKGCPGGLHGRGRCGEVGAHEPRECGARGGRVARGNREVDNGGRAAARCTPLLRVHRRGGQDARRGTRVAAGGKARAQGRHAAGVAAKHREEKLRAQDGVG